LAAMAGFLIAFPLLALLRVAHNHYVAAVLPGAMVAGAYARVSGFGVPARRAVLMLPFAALAVIRRRQLAPATIVAQTAALVFVFDPVASLAPGFHLSFGAVVLLLWLGCRRSIARVTGPAWLFVVLPLMWVLLPRGWPCHSIAVVGLLALLTWKPPAPPVGCFDAWVLDVGQKLAVAIQTRGGMTLYDTGLVWRGGGIRRISHLLVSHADLDHSGGAAILQDRLEVGRVLAGERLPGLDAARCARGISWQSGGVRFEVLHPGLRSALGGNDSSCVVRVSAGGAQPAPDRRHRGPCGTPTGKGSFVPAGRCGTGAAPWKSHLIDGGIRRRGPTR
ncbi:MAG: ComEC/Rec2 family competence protein, partial [Woeseiaceae bacterium]